MKYDKGGVVRYFKRVFSFRKFVIIGYYDDITDKYWYYIYGRIGLFKYERVSSLDYKQENTLYEFDKR